MVRPPFLSFSFEFADQRQDPFAEIFDFFDEMKA